MHHLSITLGNYEYHTSSHKFYQTSYKSCMIFLAPRKRELLDISPLLCGRNTYMQKSKENHTTFVWLYSLSPVPCSSSHANPGYRQLCIARIMHMFIGPIFIYKSQHRQHINWMILHRCHQHLFWPNSPHPCFQSQCLVAHMDHIDGEVAVSTHRTMLGTTSYQQLQHQESWQNMLLPFLWLPTKD